MYLSYINKKQSFYYPKDETERKRCFISANEEALPFRSVFGALCLKKFTEVEMHC